jgi:hypothetical protein
MLIPRKFPLSMQFRRRKNRILENGPRISCSAGMWMIPGSNRRYYQKFYEKKEDIWNHRGHRERLCALKNMRKKGRDMGR